MINFYDVDSILETGSTNSLSQPLLFGAIKLQIVAQAYNIALLTKQKELTK